MPLDELRTLLNRHARTDGITAIEGVLIGRAEKSDSPSASMTGTLMTLIAQGAKRLALGDHVYEYRAGQYLITSADLPVSGHFTECDPEQPALGFSMLLQPSAVADVLVQAPLGTVPRGGTAPPALAISNAPNELLDAVVRLLRLLDHRRDIDMLAPLIKREILWRLVTGEQGAMVRQISLADSQLSHIAKAVHWIRENYSTSFRVEHVAELVGMSSSTFFRNFQAVTGMSPIQFQKKIRLHEARLLLITHPKDIAHIGYRVGYDSSSQFSREYRRLFGASPSKDAIRWAADTPGELATRERPHSRTGEDRASRHEHRSTASAGQTS
ncbi:MULTISPECIES: AraC family transcriptional regulator [unclassified Streptomyces]|uniref:AraC family transcriptional regulator n=1 Tax=unclassified Streptomyces TaxID=2593676 RepID=UPI00081DD4DE|nr:MULTISPECIES: AraC family transcriptional regulator [unclassified Streptomyces]MYZ35512.1 helix-turn-helix domain-containing protein [Streptomyces sp. SID4917]SCF76094.1 transcriptional regulator, AraC family [Streptomyces sp. MnatMP-M17]